MADMDAGALVTGAAGKTGRDRMAADNAQTTLVVGGTGTTGRRVAARLTALGRPVRIGTRSSNPGSTGTTRTRGRLLWTAWARPT
jgi:phosphoglycerate dehydrogenase-like enzyme